MSGKRDSNPRPQPWQGCALPTELFPHYFRTAKVILFFELTNIFSKILSFLILFLVINSHKVAIKKYIFIPFAWDTYR